jgi:23S rRNA (uracil1939-C5)-methyltransferase
MERNPTRDAPIREVSIERILPGGVGMGHVGGQTVLVPMTAPGDIVRVRIDREQGRTAFGTLLDVITPSPERVEPPYPALEQSDGCDFRHLSYAAQLAAKQEIVRDSLRRIAGIANPPDVEIIPSSDPWSYRSRAEWHIDHDRGIIGSVAPNSHEVTDADQCQTLTPALAATLADLREQLRAGQIPANITTIQAVEGDDAVSIFPVPGKQRAREISVTVDGITYRLDASVFFQSNLSLLPALVEEAMWQAQPIPRPVPEGEEAPPRSVAVDFYCGVGLFTVPLAQRFDRVSGVEVHGRAATYAQKNLRASGFEHVRISTMPVDRWLATRGQALPFADLVVVDPPRSGLEPAALNGLIRLAPDRITYVSCDPATLARDLKRLLAAGYTVRRAVALDLFPQTHHVEVVAHLERAENRSTT